MLSRTSSFPRTNPDSVRGGGNTPSRCRADGRPGCAAGQRADSDRRLEWGTPRFGKRQHDLDRSNAAGHGWFIDATPFDDGEFGGTTGSVAEGRMDLLSVLAHEMGHLLGLEHDDDGFMADVLAPGDRILPAADDAVFAELA